MEHYNINRMISYIFIISVLGFIYRIVIALLYVKLYMSMNVGWTAKIVYTGK